MSRQFPVFVRYHSSALQTGFTGCFLVRSSVSICGPLSLSYRPVSTIFISPHSLLLSPEERRKQTHGHILVNKETTSPSPTQSSIHVKGDIGIIPALQAPPQKKLKILSILSKVSQRRLLKERALSPQRCELWLKTHLDERKA